MLGLKKDCVGLCSSQATWIFRLCLLVIGEWLSYSRDMTLFPMWPKYLVKVAANVGAGTVLHPPYAHVGCVMSTEFVHHVSNASCRCLPTCPPPG